MILSQHLSYPLTVEVAEVSLLFKLSNWNQYLEPPCHFLRCHSSNYDHNLVCPIINQNIDTSYTSEESETATGNSLSLSCILMALRMSYLNEGLTVTGENVILYIILKCLSAHVIQTSLNLTSHQINQRMIGI